MEKMFTILIFLAGIVIIAVAGGFAGFALIERIKSTQAKWKRLSEAGDLTGEVDELRARLDDLEQRGLASGEVEAQYGRLAELEERLDFAERLLAQRNDQTMLPGERRTP